MHGPPYLGMADGTRRHDDITVTMQALRRPGYKSRAQTEGTPSGTKHSPYWPSPTAGRLNLLQEDPYWPSPTAGRPLEPPKHLQRLEEELSLLERNARLTRYPRNVGTVASSSNTATALS